MLNDATFRFFSFLSKVNAAFHASVYAHIHMSVRNVRTCALRNVCQGFYSRRFLECVSFAWENIIHKEGFTTFCFVDIHAC